MNIEDKIMDWPPYLPRPQSYLALLVSSKGRVYITFPDLQGLRGGRSRIQKKLGEACLAAWDTLREKLFNSLVCGMPDCVEAVIKAKGGYTRF